MKNEAKGLGVYRAIFAAAAAYNVAFGLWAAFDPLDYFQWFQLVPPRYPWTWSALGTQLFLFGVLYAGVAIRPERGSFIAWVGLAGKVLSGVSWLATVIAGDLPPRTFPLVVAGDLVWWFPFLFYLLRDHPRRASIVAWLAVALHVAACTGLVAVAPGTEWATDPAARQQWIVDHAAAWTANWFIWSLASMSLLALVVMWCKSLARLGAPRLRLAGLTFIVGVGLACDLVGEIISVAALTDQSLSLTSFAESARIYGLLSPGAANGLYCLGGLGLSLIAWRVGQLRGAAGRLGIAMWIIGIGLTIAALADHRLGMIALGGAVMVLFIPWAAILAGRIDRPATDSAEESDVLTDERRQRFVVGNVMNDAQ